MAVTSFLALIIPPIPLLATLIVPALGFLFTPMSLIGAWAAWSIGMILSAFFPMFQSQLKSLGEHILAKKNGWDADEVEVMAHSSRPPKS